MKALTSSTILILILLLLFSSDSKAQTVADWQLVNPDPLELSQLLDALRSNDEQVLKLEFTPHRSEGRLEGCGYSFRIFMNDTTTQPGQPFVAHGAITYFSQRDSVPYLSIPIGLKYIIEHNSRIWERNGAVHYAYLSYGGSSLAGREYAITPGANEVISFK